MDNPCSGNRLLKTGLMCGLLAIGWGIGRRIGNNHRPRLLPGDARHTPARVPAGEVAAREETMPAPRHTRKRLYETAATLSLSVLTDSLMEHYQGCFFRPAMYIAPAVSSLTLAESVSASRAPAASGDRTRLTLFGAALLTGIAGFGFHLYNVGKREGGFSWLNLFYGSPLGAPGALAAAGVFGLCAEVMDGRAPQRQPRIAGLPAGRTVAALTAVGIMGTVAEVWLLHFRGAFHDPFMYIPVTVPVVASAAIAAAAVRPGPNTRRWASGLLKATGAAGLAGTAFHAYGIQRNMGGWANISQMAFQGPPLPAPPGFTGIALAGLGALELLGETPADAGKSYLPAGQGFQGVRP